MGISVSGRAAIAPAPGWADSVQHDTAAYERLTRTISEVALTYQALDRNAQLPQVRATEWSASWEATLLERCDDLNACAKVMRNTLIKFASEIGLGNVEDCAIDELDRLHRLSEALLECAHDDVTVMFHKQFSKLTQALTRLRAAIQEFDRARDSASATFESENLAQIPVADLDRDWREAKASMWPMSWLRKRKTKRMLQSYALSGTADPESDLKAIPAMIKQSGIVAASQLAEATPQWQGLQTDTTQVESCLALARKTRDAIIAVGQPRKLTNVISKAIYPALKGDSAEAAVLGTAQEFVNSYGRFTECRQKFAKDAGAEPFESPSQSVLSDSIATAERILDCRKGLKQWTAWCEVKEQASVLGLTPFVDAVEGRQIPSEDLESRFELSYARWWLPKVIDRSPVLRAFQRFKHEDAIDDFRQLDELARATAASHAMHAVAHELPEVDSVPRKSELGLLRHQMGLKRPSKSIREVIGGMPEAFGKLAPCLLMSPLSIAQYLPADQAVFDVVIFDEASQITTWDAIGAIARGKQAIIVGDPKQLPPTNFFGRTDDDADDELIDDHDKDLESILDEARASGLPTLQLNWHYRSRHESLIAFSNRNYYGNELVTFPAAETTDRGVTFLHLPNALYDRGKGKSRTNRAEAEAIVADAVARMRDCLSKPEDERLTYGVITFNVQQQTLIQDLFDEALRQDKELEWFFSDDRIEPTVVKNLENVQGDERDVMFFSITFGRDTPGKNIPLTFGALNRDGGERRLNVAITRARRSLIVVASFRADELKAEGTKAQGVHDLKNFLDYADRGPIAIAARTEGSVGDFESPLEEAVAEALAARGWQVEPQIGISGFRIDLGVVHPDKPGAYLAGVECDGATYHRSAVARDRDKTRQQVLENLGWAIFRVWSPDWWYDCDSAIDRLHESLTAQLESDRCAVVESQCHGDDSGMSELALASSTPMEDPTENLPRPLPDESPVDAIRELGQPNQQLVARNRSDVLAKTYYERAELSDATLQQDLFFGDNYSSVLRQMAMDVLESEAPIRDDLLARQISRAHGFGRTSGKMRQRVFDLITDIVATDESTGRFLWNVTDPLPSVPYRHARNSDERRSVAEIAMPELIGLVNENRHLLREDDPAISLAREIGLARLAQSARDRLEEAIALAAEAWSHRAQ